MIGYHYTSYEHWGQIKENGLKPELVRNVGVYSTLEREGYPQRQLFGIWIWQKQHEGRAHIGSVLRVVAIHDTTRVILLKVRFLASEKYRIAGRDLSIGHDGYIENFVCHRSDIHKAWLLKETIPPERLEVVGDYDIDSLLSSSV